MFAGRMACRVPSETPSWGVRLPPRPWVGEAGAHPLPGTSSLMWPGPWVSIESHRLLVGLALRFTALFLLELFFSDQNAGGRCAPVWRQMVACDFRETQTRNTRRHGRLQVEGLWARCSFTSLGVTFSPALSTDQGFPGGPRGKEAACQCRRCKRRGFNS